MKSNAYCSNKLNDVPISKILLIMTLTKLILLAAFMQAIAAGYGQTISLTKRNTTDIFGKFSILASPGERLVFSSVGYETKQVQVGRDCNMQIQLDVKVNALDELVVVGYTTKRASEVTGSVQSICKR